MTPRALMITGAAMGLFGAAATVVHSDVSQFAVFLLAAGAMFGKGYGVYEERTRGAVRQRAGGEDVRGMSIALDKAWESNRERQAEIERLRGSMQQVENYHRAKAAAIWEVSRDGLTAEETKEYGIAWCVHAASAYDIKCLLTPSTTLEQAP